MAVVNLAKKYSNKVDERFYRDSQAMIATNKDYDWNGVESIVVYQVDVVPMNDYQRTGTNRYGTPTDLGNTIKEYKIKKDRSFTFVIDKGDKLQSQMVMDAGKSLARQQREVIVPEVDKYIFNVMANGAVDAGNVEVGAVSSTNAYAKFLKGSEVLGNKMAPDTGRVAFCTYGYANLLMQDPAFIKYSDKSQEMVIRGELGEVDGTKIVKVPASRMPAGVTFMIVHNCATVAPEQLNEYKIHDNPPGINGWLVEGRMIYDAFVLEGKKDALYAGFLEGALATAPADVDDNGKLVVTGSYAGSLMIKAGTTLPAYGDADTGYAAVEEGDTVSADSIVAVVVDHKIIAATLLDV